MGQEIPSCKIRLGQLKWCVFVACMFHHLSEKKKSLLMITWILKRGETLEQLSALKKMLKYDILIISVFHAVSLSQVTLL